MLGVRQWLHIALRHGAFWVSRQHRLCRWWPAHCHVLFMKGWCVYSSMKQCLQSVNHKQFHIQITQDNKHNKWLEILDFQPKHLWRTPTKIHREQRRRQQQEAACKAQRTSLSPAKATSSTQWRKNTTITLQMEPWRERTPTADASKSDRDPSDPRPDCTESLYSISL